MFARLLYILDSFEVRNPRVTALMAVIQLLEFTGMQLHFEHCLHCGAPVDGEAYLSFNAGGVLCAGCREPGAENLPDSLRQFILELRDYDWENPPELRITGAQLMQAENLFLTYLQNLLGKPLKSLAFIQQL
jgi:DNA repair protein RecO (recombination protein O)